MKLSLAIALPLSLLAAAAPTPLKLKRDDGDSPSADVTSKIAHGSLKSAAQMMNMYNNDDEVTKDEAKAKANADADVPDYGNIMPIDMTPNAMATFPGADGKPASHDETKGNHTPTPVVGAAASPSASTATSHSAAPSSTVRTPGATEDGKDDGDVEDKQIQGSTTAASPSPSASAPAEPKKQSMLDELSVLSSVKNLLGGIQTH
ncbi:hypothetical protein BDV10DRAFT_31280 [Aspergillus recurvatus]